MIVRVHSAGKSFKGLGQYLTHDPKAETAERVAWTHTLNCANDHVPSAIHEMVNTYRDADLLKEEAGIKRGGAPLEHAVKHFSLNWHPDETPTREQMIEAVESYLTHMGWDAHQAVLASHTDKPHAHVHCMLNTVHPETGRALDDGFERRRSQVWARGYERENGHIYCEQRELPVEEREDAPARKLWKAGKDGERQHEAQEQARQDADREAARQREAAEPRTPGQEWTELKQAQKDARQAFFAGGKQAYSEVAREIFREVRDEFRGEWAEYYAAKKDGLDLHLLMDIRTDIQERQQDMLKDRQGGALAELRQARDAEYSALLAAQQEERDDLRARQAGIPPGVRETEKQLNDENLRQLVEWQRSTTPLPEFRAAAEDIHVREAPSGQAPGRYLGVGEEWVDPKPGAHQASGPKMRDPADIGTGLGLGALGGLATVTERFFDGFFDQPVTPAERQARQQPTPAPRNDAPRENPFEAVAEHARRRAEQEEDDRRRNEWWDERRGRARDS